MPDATPARSPLDKTLDKGLCALFSQLQTQPVPQALMDLVDRLEEAHGDAPVGAERRTVGRDAA